MEHVNIPDGERHEPRGISASPSNRVYVADGNGSGDWSQVNANTLSGLLNNSTVAGRFLVTDGSGGINPLETIDSGDIVFDTEDLTSVIQELYNRIEALESRVDALEAP